MGAFSIWHLLVLLVVVVLVFGTKKLRNMGNDLGSAVKGFKDCMNSEDEAKKMTDATDKVIDVADTKRHEKQS